MVWSGMSLVPQLPMESKVFEQMCASRSWNLLRSRRCREVAVRCYRGLMVAWATPVKLIIGTTWPPMKARIPAGLVPMSVGLPWTLPSALPTSLMT